MTIEDLKNNLLQSLYARYKENKVGAIQLTKLCKEYNIKYDSLPQLSLAAKSLKETGYINATFLTNRDALNMSLTANGIKFVEENLLQQDGLVIDSLNSTSKEIENTSPKIDINSDSKSKNNHIKNTDSAKAYTPEENVKAIKDCDVEPCFSIKDVVNSFIKQLDKIAETKAENIPMIGVFAPWGRGKSYFLNLVFQQLEDRGIIWWKNCFRGCKSQTKRYKIITFNAWKYQDTPAIWAYLYETMYKHAFWWQKCLTYARKNIFSCKCLTLFLLISCAWFIGYLLKNYTSILSKVSDLEAIGGIGTVVAIVFSFFMTLRDNPISALRIIQKYTKRKSYNECLGIQNAIESDLEDLLWALKCRKDKVLLCVDDIDRCSTEKMVNIVDSLRTVLENEKIRDRLIVICSIDIAKLMHGYKTLYNNHPSESNETNIREQIDKVFIFSLGLARLGTEQLKEYLQKLLSINKLGNIEPIKETLFNTDRQEGVLYTTNLGEQLAILSDIEIYNIISVFIAKNQSINITPRKLRVMYYQLLFANNLASRRGVVITEKLIESLLYKSLTGIENNNGNQAFGDIIEMAVPY